VYLELPVKKLLNEVLRAVASLGPGQQVAVMTGEISSGFFNIARAGSVLTIERGYIPK
jgi:hypothetical protein